MAKKFPMHPKHPERICWGCDRYCPTDAMSCGNGSDRTMHPIELLGDDWANVGGWADDASDDALAEAKGEITGDANSKARGQTDSAARLMQGPVQ